MRIEHPSSVRLAAALLIMTLASSPFTSAVNTLNINNHDTFSLSHNDEPSSLPPSLPPHIQQYLHHNQHQQLLKRLLPSSQPPTLSKRATPQGWIDYYSSSGDFINESTLTSASCLTLPSTWGILDITLATRPNPANSERDVLQFFNDKNCITVNREPATQTGWVIIAMYFNKAPQSLQWARIGASATTPTTTATTASSQSTAPTASTPASSSSSASTQTLSVSISSIPSPLPTDQLPPPDGVANPQPSHHTIFPSALIPPKPVPDSSSSSAWGDNCGGPENDPNSPGCKGARQVSHILITGITIALVVVALMASGAFYIYRKFYANALPTTTTGNSSSYRSNQPNNQSHTGGGGSYAFSGTHNMNSSASGSGTRFGSGTASGTLTGTGTGTGTGLQLGDDANPDYEYCHDQDENEPPRFMFDHRHDNVDTNRNPRLFNEGNNNTNTLAAPPSVPYPNNSSDISLIERVRK